MGRPAIFKALRKISAAFYFPALMLLGLWNPVHAPAAEPFEIVLSESAAISDDEIALSRIAAVSGGGPEDRSRIGGVIVARVPMRGQTAIVTAGQIRKALERAGFDDGTYCLTGAEAVKASRSSLTVSSDRVCAAVRDFILAQAPWPKERMTIRPIRFNQTIHLTPGTLRMEVTAPKHNDWLGNVVLGVEFFIDGRLTKRISVPVSIDVYGSVVVAAKPLGKNQPIAPQDIRVVEMNLVKAPPHAIVDPKMAIGRKATRAIAIDAVLRGDHVESLPVLQRGDLVQIVAESPTMRLSTQGMVQRNGALGDRIQVMNLSSKKVVVAQIMDEHTVRVEY